MFKFHGYLARSQFMWGAGLRIALFLASIIGFPFLVRALAQATRCGIDTCGALSLVTAMAFKPLAFVIFVFSFVGISMRRARDAGVQGWIGLFIPLLLALDYGFFVLAGAPWSLAFSVGALHIPPPRHSLLALACIAALCALPSRRDGPGSGNPFGYAGLAAFFLGLAVVAPAIIGFALAPVLIHASKPLLNVIAPLFAVTAAVPYLMICLAALLAWIVWQNFGHVAVMPSPSLPEPAPSDIPGKTLAALAFALAIVVFAVSMQSQHGGLVWIALATHLTTAVLPTALLYFCLLVTAFLVLKRRTATSVALLVLAALPFMHWLYAYRAASMAHRQEASEIAAIPTTAAARVPPTMVVNSRSMPELRAIWAVKGIEQVIVVEAFGNTTLREFNRPPDGGRSPRPREVVSLPDEYLLLRVGPASRFSQRGRLYGAAGGPLELRYVDLQHDELVGVWYRVFNPGPTFPPMLTATGWFRGANSATTDEVNASLSTFLNKSLDAAGRKLAVRSE